MPGNIELHFQEGFAGETVDVTVDGKAAAHFVARTRVQTGLAHIQRLTLSDGAVVRITIPATGAEASIKASEAQPHITINLQGAQITLEARKDSPGYM